MSTTQSDGTADQRSNTIGAATAMVATIFFSLNDVTIKYLSGGYALHEIVLIRSVVGILAFSLFVLPFSGGLSVLRTRRLGLHLMRGAAVVMANLLFFLGLSVLPLATTVAIFFVSPLIITIFSVVFLKEHVGWQRWSAVLVGLAGAVIMMRPGADTLNLAVFFPLGAAVGYATLHTLTRKMRVTESATTMTFYIQLVFVAVCVAIGLAVGDGRYSEGTEGAMNFLLRPWIWPAGGLDYALLLLIGLGTVTGGWCISQAYRLGEAAFVAPFEYAALPMAVVFGIVLFDEWPDLTALLGMALIVGAGLFVLWRETVRGRRIAAAGVRMRR